MPPDFKITPEMIKIFKAMSPEQRTEALKHIPAELHEKLQ